MVAVVVLVAYSQGQLLLFLDQHIQSQLVLVVLEVLAQEQQPMV
jgi:hypothetical protein